VLHWNLPLLLLQLVLVLHVVAAAGMPAVSSVAGTSAVLPGRKAAAGLTAAGPLSPQAAETGACAACGCAPCGPAGQLAAAPGLPTLQQYLQHVTTQALVN
jgi:hypothetical protein